jgi:hypothetical protein
MELNKCDLMSAVKFAGHNQTCYHLAMAVAQAKDEDAKAEKEALIDKACEWLQKHINDYLVKGRDIDYMFDDFLEAMKGGQL